MEIKILLLNVFLPLILLYPQNKSTIVDNNYWETYFEKAGVKGTFVLSKLDSDTMMIYNRERSKNTFLPASTFKILNSLISLETKVIENEDEIIKWDGKKRFYDKWNQDHNLKSAIKYSCVWFYQELARRVGEEKMQFYLDTTKYGNSKIGTDIDKFWLEGELRISAIEQIEFLKNFIKKELPFSENNHEIVKNILLVEETKDYKFYAKTGWAARIKPAVGWYVGFVERESDIWVFAMNIEINEDEQAKYRQEITRQILESEKLLKEHE